MKTMVADFLNRTDITTANVGNFLNIAMHILEQGQVEDNGKIVSHNWLAMQKRQTTTGTLTGAIPDSYLTFPTRIKEIKWMKMYIADDSRWYDLELRDPNIALSLYPFDSSVQDRPVMASLIYAQNAVLLRPNPDAAYVYDCCFYAFSADMSDAADHNDWTDYHYEILLYGALLQAQPFIMNDPRIPVWEKMYTDATIKLMRQEKNQEISGIGNTIESLMPAQLCVPYRRYNINSIE